MRAQAHVQRPVLQTAAGASESLLNNHVFRSCVHLTPVRETEAMHRFARTGGCLQNMMLNKHPVWLAWLSARHVLQTAAGANEMTFNHSSLRSRMLM